MVHVKASWSEPLRSANENSDWNGARQYYDVVDSASACE